MSERMPEYISKDMSEVCQTRMSEDMSEDMSEKNIRRYIRRNVTKNVSIELQAPRRPKTDVATAILA